MIKENESPWVISAYQKQKFPKISGNNHTEWVVVGGNMTGMMSAYLLHKSGHKVIVVDRGETGYGETSYSTGFLTYATDIMLQDLCEQVGEKKARLVWEAGNKSIDLVEKIVNEEKIDCGFKRVSEYLFTLDENDQEFLKNEEMKARKLGFPVVFKECEDCLDFKTKGHIEYPNQAKFDPTKFVLGLANFLKSQGVEIYEKSDVLKIEKHEGKSHVKFADAEIVCDNVVLATHTPFTAPIAIETMKLIPFITYVIEAEIPHGKITEGLYLDTHDPYHYLRIDQLNETTDRLVLGGEDHEVGKRPKGKPHDNLENFLKELIPGLEYNLVRRWSGEIFNSGDEIPLIGKINGNQIVGTGFSGNGLSFGTVTAMFARDYSNNVKEEWHDVFNPNRLIINLEVMKHGMNAGIHMIKGMLDKGEKADFDEMLPDSGQIVNIDGKKVAVYKNKKGEIIKLNPKCTHLGCTVGWNEEGKTWDCPCHGGRYYGEGKVQSGPPPRDLEKL